MVARRKKQVEEPKVETPVVAPETTEVEETEGGEEGEGKGPGKIHRAIEMLLKGMSTSDIVLQLSGGQHTADIHKDDSTAIVYANKNGESSARNAVRAARAALHALVKLGVIDSKFTPKSSATPKMSDEERKAKAAERRKAKKAAHEAEKAELEALRKQVTEATK